MGKLTPVLKKYDEIYPERYKTEYASRLWQSTNIDIENGDGLAAESKLKNAKYIYEERLTQQELNKNIDYITLIMNLGLSLYMQSKFDTSEIYLKEALKLIEPIQDQSLDNLEVAAQVNQNLGTLYLSIDHNHTNKYYQKALEYLLKINKTKPNTDLEYIKRLEDYLKTH